ncbi:hypothetical protein DOY81_015340, partial [Sarcophaga bullata]
ACGETVQEFLLFIMGIQQVAVTTENLSNVHKCSLYAISIALLTLTARVTGINNLLEYAQKIIEDRKHDAPYFLPPLMDPKKSGEKYNLNLPHLSIDKMALAECLQNAGMDFNRLQTGLPYALNQADNPGHRHSWVETKTLAPEYTVDAMKRYLAEPSESVKREQQEKQLQIVRTFRE